VAAGARDRERVLRPEELLYCEQGIWTRGARKIHDTHPVGWATPATVLRESSNICAAKIGEKLGKEKLIAGLRASDSARRLLWGSRARRGSAGRSAPDGPHRGGYERFGQG